MIEVRQTDDFAKWFKSLKDRQVRTRIQARIDHISLGNFGDCESVGGGVFEMRIHFGPGYRVYFVQRGTKIVVLLAGGSKQTQSKDILKAKTLADNL
ncbi:MAG: addiction module antitoxin RelB [Nitrospinae bacterium CG22_combo_CG10-13_8_21_14_all_47_10]|nr:MAG: addiction module antitoxin RelB [Nitrospinae bacterium CG22_combo_CG10-13_8_21_14_all_47_10]